AALLTLTTLAMASLVWAQGEREDLTGFSRASADRQRQLEQRITSSLSTGRIEEHLRWLTSRPHPPGSEGARLTAEYLHQRLVAYGFDTETVRYDGYLTAPVSVSLDLLAPVSESLPTVEPQIPGDAFTETADQHPGWAGYSPSGAAVGEVVYAHFGSEEDFHTLKEMGVEVEDKILLMRNFGTGAGRKIHNAERLGAAGVVLYTDPAEDGYPFGDVYPAGNWRPPGSIMRRSLIFLPYEGDPLSPGWASVPGAKRLSPEEVALPGIPVLPVSYATAGRILEHLAGPVAPAGWQGRLPLTYKLGPGSAKLRLATEMDNRDRPMLNVIGRLEGAEEPDQWIVVGNHHDAWIYGAGDPSSGTAALLELARVLGELARDGYRPRRTLILAFWDAEEMLLGGSTEWVEDHAAELLEKAVACINMDSAVFNPDRPLSVAAHPILHALFRSVARDVEDPRTGQSTFEVWRDLQNRFKKVPGVDGWGEFFDPGRRLTEPWVFEIPYDDAAPFFSLLALPSSDMYYGADYGMYHSLYENFHWMRTVVDPTFEYHLVMTQMQGFTALRLANADLLPLDFAEEARYWRLAYRDLDRVASERGQEVPKLKEALELIDTWESEAEALAAEARGLLADKARQQAAGPRLAELNQHLNKAVRDLFRPAGRPDAPFDRNLFAGGSYEFEAVSGSTLPGIRFALDQGEPGRAASETEIYLAALAQRVETLRSITAEIQRWSQNQPAGSDR
ncbi:MAG: M28 family peptidase, partial [Thermoanaerobaculia bacterium]